MSLEHLKKIEILESSGFPLIIYDMERKELERKEMLSDKKVFKSSLLVVAVQGLVDSGTVFNVVESENEKFLLVKKGPFSLVLTLDPKANAYDEKIQLFARSVLIGFLKMLEKLNIEADQLTVEEYIKRVEEPFKKLVNKIIEKVFKRLRPFI